MSARLLIFFYLILPFGCKSDSSHPKNEINRDFFVADVFMRLKIESLTDSVRAELLTKLKLDSIDGETHMTMDIDSINNSIFIQSCYIESSTMPCENYDIRSYQFDSINFEIIYSKNSVSYADKYQDEFKIYQYCTTTKILKEDLITQKVFNIQLKDFFNANTPDSIINSYAESVNPIFSFQDSKIFCTVSDCGYGNTLNDEKWLEGNTIEIIWNGKNFKILRIYKEQ
jgi:hypothetical protein